MTLLDEAKEAKNFVKSVYPNSFFRNRNIFYTCFKSKIGLEIPISKDNISMILPFPSSIIEQLAFDLRL